VLRQLLGIDDASEPTARARRHLPRAGALRRRRCRAHPRRARANRTVGPHGGGVLLRPRRLRRRARHDPQGRRVLRLPGAGAADRRVARAACRRGGRRLAREPRRPRPDAAEAAGPRAPPAMQGGRCRRSPTRRRARRPSRSTGPAARPARRADLATLPRPRGLEAAKATLRWREAEGRRKMVRTRRFKLVTDPTGDSMSSTISSRPVRAAQRGRGAGPCGAGGELRAELLRWSVTTEDARPVPLPAARLAPAERSRSTT
jgi:hypothetical protein